MNAERSHVVAFAKASERVPPEVMIKADGDGIMPRTLQFGAQPNSQRPTQGAAKFILKGPEWTARMERRVHMCF